MALLAGVAAVVASAAPGLVETPLAPRSGPRGKTMFALLSPAETGLVTENNYSDPKMWGDLNQEFRFGAIGTGVAIGDYDNDGRPDIFVVSKTGVCRLFRNLGNFKFEDVTEKAGLGASAPGWADRLKGLVGAGDEADGGWNQGATFVDINNDGWLDIYVCRFNAPNLLYINQHDGTFKEMAHAYGLDVKDACGMAAFCDYDRDGRLDVYIQTNLLSAQAHPAGQRDYLFHQNPDGTFTDVTTAAGISGETQGHSVDWWDYDGDGWPDIYVANDFGPPDILYHNNRDGTFTNVSARVLPHTPHSAMGSDTGDVNNDGRIDLLVADMAATTHEKDQRGMSRIRALLRDDDGDPVSAPQFMSNALLLNTGTGRMLEAAHLAGLAATDWTWSVRLEDLDNDGRLDVFFTNGMVRELHNADLTLRMSAAESLPAALRLLKASPVFAESNLAFRNLGGLQFEDVSAAWGLNQKGVSFGAAFGDLDGDGDLDLVVANYNQGVTLLRNDSDTGHRLIIALRGTQSNRFGVGATVRIESASGGQVRQLVLARGYLSSSEPILHFGLGDDPRVNRMTVIWPSGRTQVFTDLAVDRHYTVTEPATPSVAPDRTPPPPAGQFTEVSRAENLALMSRQDLAEEPEPQPLLPFRFNRRGPALAVGDLNGDGRDDVLLGGTTKDPIRALRARSAGGFEAMAPGWRAADPAVDDGPVLILDTQGNGANDVLVTKGGTRLPAGDPGYQPELFLNDGQGRFHLAPEGTLPAFPVSVGALAAADFSHEGRLGVFVGGRVIPGRYPLAPRSALWANRGGRFEDVTDSLAPGLREVGMVTSALWSDVDGDGWPDLLVTLEWGEVKYFHNEAGRGFSDWTEKAGFAAAGTGWWNSIATADFNGDGRPDFVVGNLGLNTQYTASPAHPALIYYGVFADGRLPQLVEAYFEDGRLYPWRNRQDLGALIPTIQRRFPKNDQYARASLDEILGEDRLAAARKFSATEFRSGVFLSQPDGTYRFEPLPRIAQIAPLQGLVAGDLDGDGKADIYAVQNFFAPIPLVGRFDGGLSQLLRGDGHGHFAPASPLESGLVVPGDAKALAMLDLAGDGWPGFIVSRNNGATLAFRNQGVAGRHELRVSLRGPAGNPTAVGARVTLELADGSTQTGEIAAGAGYWSQSAAACFFGYPDGNPPRQALVRWPDGTHTTSAVPFGATVLSLPATQP